MILEPQFTRILELLHVPLQRIYGNNSNNEPCKQNGQSLII